MQREIGGKSTDLPTDAVDQPQVRQAPRLFVNLSVCALMAGALTDASLKKLLSRQGGLRERVVLELNDNNMQVDSASVVATVRALRDKGFSIALNDMGSSCLHLWSDSRPDFIKLGQHLLDHIDTDMIKQQFLGALKLMAEKSGARLIAVGIETTQALQAVKNMGVCLGQGNLLGAASDVLSSAMSPGIDAVLNADPQQNLSVKIELVRGQRALSLLTEVPTVTTDTSSEAALQILLNNPELNVLPVLKNGMPAGLLNRTMVDKFSHGYIRDLYSRKPCSVFMDIDPLIVDVNMSIVALSQMVLSSGHERFNDGFILVRDGSYAGIGSNFSLMQAMSQQQILQARYANPLTQLPGNVPINEHMQALLDHAQEFWAAYVDLDNFKPFNDVFGYRRGDDLIKLTANILVECVEINTDFVGHVGGDDFFVLFQSLDWAQRCQNILSRFDAQIIEYAKEYGIEAGCYVTEDRRGNRTEYPLPTLSIGVVPVTASRYHEIQEISAVAAEVKSAAKRIAGSSMYIDQRNG